MKRVTVRWSVGPLGKIGFRCLKESINQIARIYPQFHRIVYFNQLGKKEVDELKKVNAEVEKSPSSVPGWLKPQKGYEVHWKLYPPRVDIDSYEIFLDSDIVLHRQLPQIEEAVSNAEFILYEGRHGLYGGMESFFTPERSINSGLFGLPPGFDFEDEIRLLMKNKLVCWGDRFDEQGMVAYLLHDKPHQFVSQIDVPIAEESEDFADGFGTHFVGINYNDHHIAWEQYWNGKLL